MKLSVNGVTATVLCSTLLFLSACGSNAKNDSAGEQTSPQPSASQVASPVTLKVLITGDWMNETWKGIFLDYEKSSGNKLDVQTLPGGAQFEQLVQTKIATKDVPDILFYYSDQGHLNKIMPETNLIDLSGEPYMSRINPVVKKYYLQSNGKMYGIPTSGMNVGGVLYNKEVFKRLNLAVPKTYDEFLALCEQLKAAGVTPLYEAAKDAWPLQIYTFNGFGEIINAQPDIIDKLNTHQTTFDQTEAYLELLQRQADLKAKGYLNSDLFSGTYDMSLDQLAAGKVGMVIQADWAFPVIEEKYPDAEIAMFPQPFVNGEAYVPLSDPRGAYAFKATKNEAAAKQFLEYLADPQTLSVLYEAEKSIPSWTGVDAPVNPGIAEIKAIVDTGKGIPFFNGLLNVAIGDTYPALLQDLYGEKKTPAEMARAMQENYDKSAKAAGLSGW